MIYALIVILSGIKELILSMNENITDEGLKHLGGIQSLYLESNTNITVKGVKYLSGIKEFVLDNTRINCNAINELNQLTKKIINSF